LALIFDPTRTGQDIENLKNPAEASFLQLKILHPTSFIHFTGGLVVQTLIEIYLLKRSSSEMKQHI